jgi:hypothetical protein
VVAINKCRTASELIECWWPFTPWPGYPCGYIPQSKHNRYSFGRRGNIPRSNTQSLLLRQNSSNSYSFGRTAQSLLFQPDNPYSQIHQSQSGSHVSTDGQSVGLSWCRAPFGAPDQILIMFWKLQSCKLGAPSLTRSRVCRLSESVIKSIVSISIHKIIYIIQNLSVVHIQIYKASVSPGSVHQIMP